MQLSVSGHHVDITNPLRDYVGTKFERIERHFDQVTDVHVILSVEKINQKAEATVHYHGTKLYAEDVQEDMYAAIDGLTDKLDRQVRKQKEKLTQHR